MPAVFLPASNGERVLASNDTDIITDKIRDMADTLKKMEEKNGNLFIRHK